MREPTRVGTLPISAASGLAAFGDALAVVADDELDLVVCDHAGRLRGRHPLRDGGLPDAHAARKAAKPDLEALCALDGGLLALGSCSTDARCVAFWLPTGPGGVVRAVELTPLAARLAGELPALNLEGAVVLGERVVLLHRGGAAGPSAWIELAAGDVRRGLAAGVLDVELRALRELPLGDVDGVPLSITDGCAVGDDVYATATAEDTPDPVRDGVAVGHALLRLGRDGVRERWPLAVSAKPEGVAFAAGALFLCVDADDRRIPSPLYRLDLPLR